MNRSNILFSLRSFVILCLVLFISFTLSSCANIAGYQRQYAGAPKSLREVALLTHRNPYSRVMHIRAIDEQKTFSAGLWELSEGKHKLSTHFIKSGAGSTIISSSGVVDVNFNAISGHVYVLYHVLKTHNKSWYPAIWDITSELGSPEHKKLVGKIDAILKKNRPGETLPSVASLATNIPKTSLPGFGEKIHRSLKPWVDKDVDVTFSFNRYKPFLLAKGSDGEKYHIQVNPVDGSIINVFGREVSVGKRFEYIIGFQPLNSDLAYVGGDYVGKPDYKHTRIYRQASDGTYDLISK